MMDQGLSLIPIRARGPPGQTGEGGAQWKGRLGHTSGKDIDQEVPTEHNMQRWGGEWGCVL